MGFLWQRFIVKENERLKSGTHPNLNIVILNSSLEVGEIDRIMPLALHAAIPA